MNNKRPITGIMATLLLSLLVFLISCSGLKKDQVAVNRVNGNAKLQDTVMRRWFETHPQDTSRKVIEIPGKEIKVPIPVLIRDTTAERKTRDSLLAIKSTDCNEKVKAAFDLAYQEAEKYYEENPVTVKCPPSTHTTEIDHSALDRANAAINQEKLGNAFLAGQSAQKTAQISSQGHSLTVSYWVIGGLVGLLLLSVFFNVKTFIPNLIKKVKI